MRRLLGVVALAHGGLDSDEEVDALRTTGNCDLDAARRYQAAGQLDID